MTSTADQWERDLGELLGLDVARPESGGARAPYRVNALIVGALAIAASLSVGMAVQRRSGGAGSVGPAGGRSRRRDRNDRGHANEGVLCGAAAQRRDAAG